METQLNELAKRIPLLEQNLFQQITAIFEQTKTALDSKWKNEIQAIEAQLNNLARASQNEDRCLQYIKEVSQTLPARQETLIKHSQSAFKAFEEELTAKWLSEIKSLSVVLTQLKSDLENQFEIQKVSEEEEERRRQRVIEEEQERIEREEEEKRQQLTQKDRSLDDEEEERRARVIEEEMRRIEEEENQKAEEQRQRKLKQEEEDRKQQDETRKQQDEARKKQEEERRKREEEEENQRKLREQTEREERRKKQDEKRQQEEDEEEKIRLQRKKQRDEEVARRRKEQEEDERKAQLALEAQLANSNNNNNKEDWSDIQKQLGRIVNPSYRKSLNCTWDELEVITRVGQGAFAEVYEALKNGQRVAVKKLIVENPNELAKAKAELDQEVNIMSKLHSNYHVALYGVCSTPPAMIMEFLPHGSVNHLLYDVTKELPWDRRWSFAYDVAVGLSYMHSRKPPILHRDLKSGNLLISSNWRVKITDFGLSIFKPPVGVPQPPFEGGTDRWTAPEILNGQPYTEAADVFSFGAILYEIACRKLPFSDASPEECRKLWVRGDRPPISGDEEIPDDFEKLIRMCWDQNAFNRPTFPYIVNFIRRKGHTGKTVPIVTPLDEFEKTLKEHEELEGLKERFEKQRNEAERFSQRDRNLVSDLDKQKEDLDRQLGEERKQKWNIDREVADLQSQVRLVNEQMQKLEQAKRDAEKKQKKDLERSHKGAQEELQDYLVELDKRIKDEDMKNNQMLAQITETERRLKEHIQHREDMEKKINQLKLDVETEKRKTRDTTFDVDTLERKLTTEKKNLDRERKKNRELEEEREEEQKKLARRSSSAT